MNTQEIRNQKRNKMLALTISIALHLIAAFALVMVTQPDIKTTVKGWFDKEEPTEAVSQVRS